MKVYGEIGPKKILKFQSVWLYKYSPNYDSKATKSYIVISLQVIVLQSYTLDVVDKLVLV